MRIPASPPKYNDLVKQFQSNFDSDKFVELFMDDQTTDGEEYYYHWDKIRRVLKSERYSIEELWLNIKHRRLSTSRVINLSAKNESPFRFNTPDFIQKELLWLDKHTAGSISSSMEIVNSSMMGKFYQKSLYEEAISSSQMEGAVTTRKQAKKMLSENKPPRNKDEQMILNNFKAMQYIKEVKDEDLSIELILDLHEIVTLDTLDDPYYMGRFRTTDEVTVSDINGNIIHVPPPAEELKKYMEQLCYFTNTEIHKKNIFIHPIIKAIILHFMIGYIHPFEDGNGRTARALFYWYMAKCDFWLMEFISISKILKEAPSQYCMSYLYTETDENDLTYFIDHQLKTIVRAVKELQYYMSKKIDDIASAQRLLKNNEFLKKNLNFRQLALLKHAMKTPRYAYSISEHKGYYKISPQTARNDLMDMAEKYKLFEVVKSGRSYIFLAREDIETIINDYKK